MRQELESSFATVFRQTMMARYESDAYAARSEGRTLTPDRLCEMWLDRNRGQYGDAVELPDGYRLGWSYIPHFINTRFYTYAYAFAHLASLVLYATWREQGDAFVPKYLAFLAQGGAASPGRPAGRVRHRPDVRGDLAPRAGRDGAAARAGARGVSRPAGRGTCIC